MSVFDQLRFRRPQRRLFDRLLLTNPELRWDGRRIFPEAYRHTVTEGAPVRLPEPRRWWWGVGGIVAAWLILSTIAWLVLTGPTRRTLAVTMQSLDIVTNRRSDSAASSKWRAIPFELQDGAFRLATEGSRPYWVRRVAVAVARSPIYLKAAFRSSASSALK